MTKNLNAKAEYYSDIEFSEIDTTRNIKNR